MDDDSHFNFVISLHEPLQRYHRWSTVLQTTPVFPDLEGTRKKCTDVRGSRDKKGKFFHNKRNYQGDGVRIPNKAWSGKTGVHCNYELKYFEHGNQIFGYKDKPSGAQHLIFPC